MGLANHFSVCYLMDGIEHIIHQSDANVKVTPLISNQSDEEQEINLNIENCSDRDIFLKTVTLWEADKEPDLHVGEAPLEVYRSGRHKNDMPGTFTLGIDNARIRDVLGAMSESGDKTESEGHVRKVVSDHLTVIKGSEIFVLHMVC